MNKSKILFIQSTSSLSSGSTKSLEIILDCISKNSDFDFGIVLPSTDGAYKKWKDRDWKVYSIQNRHNNYPPSSSFKDLMIFVPRFIAHKYINFRAQNKIKEIIIKEKYNIVHTNVGVLDIGFKLAKKLKIQHIWHLREYQDLDFNEKIFPSKKKFIKRLKNSYNYTLAITEQIYIYFKIDKSKGVVLSDAVLENIPETINWDKQDFILYVGRVSKEKGIFDLIEAIKNIKNDLNNHKIIVAGAYIDNKTEIEIKKILQEYHLEGTIEFLGIVSDVTKLMKMAKCLVMPSHFEGLGRVTIEAMANGCLVIGKDAYGTKEQFDNGINLTGKEIGLRYSTLPELQEWLLKVCNENIDQYKDMIVNAQEVVYQLYHINSYYLSLKEIYNKRIEGNEIKKFQ